MRAAAFVLLAMALPLAATSAAAAASPSIAGVWDGTIGNLPVRVCFNQQESGTSGGYYYRSHLQAIPLEQSDKSKPSFVEGVAEPDATTPRWAIGKVEGDTLAGQWKQGAKSLPITLQRVMFQPKGDETPCGSMLFHGPRLEGIRTISKPAVKDGVPYTRLILDHRGHFGDDVSIETFALPEDNPGARAINAELRKALATTGDDSWLACIRSSWDWGGGLGDMSETLSPRMISKHWLVALDDAGGFCGGAHPDDAQTPKLFDRRTGKQVDVLSWFSARAIKREKFEGDPNYVETFQPEFRKLILTGWKPDDDCGESVRGAEFWNAELTRTGFIFTPSLAHVEEACEEPFRVPFARLAPYLTAKGKKEVAALEAEVASRR